MYNVVMKKSTFEWERKLIESEQYSFVIGTDEAGRGPLAGPVVASATIAKNRDWKNMEGKVWDLVRDSKKLSPKQRETVYEFVLENFYVGIGICDHKTIDEMNILEASFLAMKKALTDLYVKVNQDLAKNENGGARRIHCL